MVFYDASDAGICFIPDTLTVQCLSFPAGLLNFQFLTSTHIPLVRKHVEKESGVNIFLRCVAGCSIIYTINGSNAPNYHIAIPEKVFSELCIDLQDIVSDALPDNIPVILHGNISIVKRRIKS